MDINRNMGQIEAVRRAKEKMFNAKSSRQVNRTQAYKIKEREVKRSISVRKYKRIFIESLASKAEEAAEMGELSTAYKITKQLCGNNSNHTMSVKTTTNKQKTGKGNNK